MADGGRSIEDVAMRIGALIKALGMTQVGFANLVGVSQSAVNNYLQAVRRPDPDVAIDISIKTGVTTDWLYHGERAGLPARLLAILPDLSSVEQRRAKV